MNLTSWRLRLLAAGFVILALVVPAFAQDETADEPKASIEGLGRIIAEVSGWISQPGGADVAIALRQPSDTSLGAALETIPTGTDTGLRYRGGYEFRDNIGTFVLTWYSVATELQQTVLTPSTFQFSEILTVPLYPGVFDDGLADGYASTATLKTRDLRLDYYRDFVSTPRVDARWFVGYRRVNHIRTGQTEYYSLVPNLPPILDPLGSPRQDLVPGVDFALTESNLSARGVEAGIEVELPVWRKRVWVDAGLSVSAMRGRLSTSYSSRTHVYTFRGDLAPGVSPYVDPNDPDAFEDSERLAGIRQEAVDVSVRSRNEGTDMAVIDASLGFRWQVWKSIQVLGGYRATHYQGAAQDIAPAAVAANGDLTRFTVQGIERREHSLTLEGYYLGVAWGF